MKLILYVIAALPAFVFVAPAFCAPAPSAKKKEAVPAIVGTWDVAWESETYRMTFSKDGCCGAHQIGGGQSVWSGTWELKGGELHVSEKWVNAEPVGLPLVWSVTLDRCNCGTAKIIRHRNGDGPCGSTADLQFSNKR